MTPTNLARDVIRGSHLGTGEPRKHTSHSRSPSKLEKPVFLRIDLTVTPPRPSTSLNLRSSCPKFQQQIPSETGPSPPLHSGPMPKTFYQLPRPLRVLSPPLRSYLRPAASLVHEQRTERFRGSNVNLGTFARPAEMLTLTRHARLFQQPHEATRTAQRILRHMNDVPTPSSPLSPVSQLEPS